MTLSDLQSHSLTSSLAKCDFSCSRMQQLTRFNWRSASRGFSAIAELPVVLYNALYDCLITGINVDGGADTQSRTVQLDCWKTACQMSVDSWPRDLWRDVTWCHRSSSPSASTAAATVIAVRQCCVSHGRSHHSTNSQPCSFWQIKFIILRCFIVIKCHRHLR